MIFQLLLAAALLATPSQSTAPHAVPTSDEEFFLEAIRHWGSSTTDAAIVTVRDEVAGVDYKLCVDIDGLAWAVAEEHALPVNRAHRDQIAELMRSQRDRRFVFKKAKALSYLGRENGYPDADKEVCALLRQGVYALRGDRPATLIVGEVLQ